jgi:hypothetical protein
VLIIRLHTGSVPLTWSRGASIENTASAVKTACLLVCYLAIDVLYCRVLLYPLPSNGLFNKNLSPRNVFIEPLPSSGSIRHNIKIDLRRCSIKVYGFFRIGPVAGSCEHGNEISSAVKCEELLANYQLLEEKYTPLSKLRVTYLHSS